VVANLEVACYVTIEGALYASMVTCSQPCQDILIVLLESSLTPCICLLLLALWCQ
jgi:hypothetical protein